FTFSGRRRFWTLSRAQRSCRCFRQRRIRHRPLPFSDGSRRHVRNPRRPLFLVSKNVRAPSQRTSRQTPFLAHLRRSLLCIHAHALARPHGPLARRGRRICHQHAARPSARHFVRRVASHVCDCRDDSHPRRSSLFFVQFCL